MNYRTVWNEGIVEGPEALLLIAMFRQAILDAVALSKRQIRLFRAAGNKDQYSEHGRMVILGTQNMSLRNWMNSDQFAWYATLLGFKPKEVQAGLESVLRGEKTEVVKSYSQLLKRPRSSNAEKERAAEVIGSKLTRLLTVAARSERQPKPKASAKVPKANCRVSRRPA